MVETVLKVNKGMEAMAIGRRKKVRPETMAAIGCALTAFGLLGCSIWALVDDRFSAHAPGMFIVLAGMVCAVGLVFANE